MVRESRQAGMLVPEGGPIGAEVEFLVGMGEAVEEMAGLEARPAIVPDAFLELVRGGEATRLQGLLDDLERRHLEAGMASAKTLGQGALHLVVGTALGVRG